MTKAKPKISVNKLGEYVHASPSRRRTIIQNQKNPPEFITTRYIEARDAYINYLLSKFDKSVIDNAKDFLDKKKTSSDFQANDKESSIEALDCFDKIPYPLITVLEISVFNGNGKMDIAGVNVSVMPDIILRGERRGKKVVGAIKFHIVKATLSDDACKTVATVLHQFIETNVKSSDEFAPGDLTFVIDVFSHKCEKAPKSFTRRRGDVQASCQEYAALWPTI